MTREELIDEYKMFNMLQSNINQMMITNDIHELNESYYWATTRLATLRRKNSKRIKDAYREDCFDLRNEFLNR